MKYFSPAFFKFFDALSKNNNKEWFDSNRETYENEVKKPFRKLMEDLTEKMVKELPELNRDVSKSIFRINRDIRFSKDKSPYKNHFGGVLTRKGTKDQDYPGFYLHLGADEIMVGGGKYFVSKEDLVKIRQEIFYNNTAFKKILNEKSFKEKYKTLDGGKSKILDPTYKEFLKEQPLIANKQFWYWAKLSRKEATGDKFDQLVLSYFKAGMKMNKFLWEAIKITE
ncbi:MAG: hypothetical protein JWO06_3100 [Bacteroidota bacterium]|nr:hypothetical protein [Bacteroidota bacterium]